MARPVLNRCLIFCLLEIVYQVIRIRDCSYRLNFGVYMFTGRAMVIFCISFGTVVYTTFKIFENVAFKLQLSIEFQMKAIKEKLNCVNFFCEELKDPLQRLSGAFESAKSSFLLDDKSKHFARKSFENIHEIRAIVDRLLIFLKMEEGRFAMQNLSVLSRQEISSIFQRIIVDPLSMPDYEKSKRFSCYVEAGIEKVFIDRFVISTLLSELYCSIIKILRIDGPIDSFKKMDLRVQTDFKTLRVKIFVNFEINGIPFESKFIWSNIMKITKNCNGELHISDDKVVIELPCLRNDLDDSSDTVNSAIHDTNDSTIDNCTEPFEANLVAHIYVSRPTFIQCGFKMFENAGIECKEIVDIEEISVGNPDIIILEREGIKLLLADEKSNISDCLLVLLNSGNAYYDNPEEYNGLDIVSLPFPCLFSDVKQVRDSYNNKKRLSRMPKANASLVDTPKMNASSIGGMVGSSVSILYSVYQALIATLKYLSNNPKMEKVIGQKFIYKRRSLMMNLFSHDVEKGFHEWRLLNSAMSWILILYTFVFIAFRLLVTFFHLQQNQLVYIVMFLGVGLRRQISRALGLSISTYWFCYGVILILIECFLFLQLFVTCVHGSCSIKMPSPKGPPIESDKIGSLNIPHAIAIVVFNFQTNHFGW